MQIFYTENKQTGRLIFSILVTLTKKRKTKNEKWNEPDKYIQGDKYVSER